MKLQEKIPWWIVTSMKMYHKTGFPELHPRILIRVNSLSVVSSLKMKVASCV